MICRKVLLSATTRYSNKESVDFLSAYSWFASWGFSDDMQAAAAHPHSHRFTFYTEDISYFLVVQEVFSVLIRLERFCRGFNHLRFLSVFCIPLIFRKTKSSARNLCVNNIAVFCFLFFYLPTVY